MLGIYGKKYRSPARRFARSRARRTGGLTLMETTLATIIMGLSVLSVVKLVGATTAQTSYSQKLTTAFMLANNVRELMAGLPFNDPIFGTHTSGPNSGQTNLSQFNDVEDFNGQAFNPPIDANRQTLSNLGNWQQSVTVTMLGDANGYGINNANTTSGISNPAIVECIRVTISFRPSAAVSWTPIVSSSWIKTKY